VPEDSSGLHNRGYEHAKPKVIVGEDEHGNRYFYLVMVERRAKKPGMVMLRWLEEHADGLFRPAHGLYLESERALVDVRTQWMSPQGRRKGGFKLLTLKSRILDTEFVD